MDYKYNNILSFRLFEIAEEKEPYSYNIEISECIGDKIYYIFFNSGKNDYVATFTIQFINDEMYIGKKMAYVSFTNIENFEHYDTLFKKIKTKKDYDDYNKKYSSDTNFNEPLNVLSNVLYFIDMYIKKYSREDKVEYIGFDGADKRRVSIYTYYANVKKMNVIYNVTDENIIICKI
jgi:hypothetical protein